MNIFAGQKDEMTELSRLRGSCRRLPTFPTRSRSATDAEQVECDDMDVDLRDHVTWHDG